MVVGREVELDGELVMAKSSLIAFSFSLALYSGRERG